MENIILNIWIDMKNGLKVRLLEKPGPEKAWSRRYFFSDYGN